MESTYLVASNAMEASMPKTDKLVALAEAGLFMFVTHHPARNGKNGVTIKNGLRSTKTWRFQPPSNNPKSIAVTYAGGRIAYHNHSERVSLLNDVESILFLPINQQERCLSLLGKGDRI